MEDMHVVVDAADGQRLAAHFCKDTDEIGVQSMRFGLQDKWFSVLGGIEDHVHILHSLGRTHSVAWVMEKLKSNSSRWMKEQGAAQFWWQPGYAAFSVGRSELERAKRYIHRQREHHRQHSFEQELRALCAREPADASALEAFLTQEPRRGGTR